MLFRDFQRVQLNSNIYGHKSNCKKAAALWVFCNMLFFADNLIFKRIHCFRLSRIHVTSLKLN